MWENVSRSTYPLSPAERVAPRMPRAMDLSSFELDVWQEIASPGSLAEALGRLLARIATLAPVESLALRRVDTSQATLETVVVVHRSDGPHVVLSPETTTLPPRLLSELVEDDIVIGNTALAADSLRALVPTGLHGAFVLAALGNPGRPLAVVVLLATAGADLDAEYFPVVRAVLAPLTSLVRREFDRRPDDPPSSARVRSGTEVDDQRVRGPTDAILGNLRGLAGVMSLVARVAPSEVPVLVLGETGVGKEVVARTIHEHSPRRGGPLIKVNCGAIPAELVDSELFGHERGSFTGAVAARKGWFERADQGTLFLDEVGELPLAAQVRLLRVLQDGMFERVGGQRTQTVSVRVIAATHRDLTQMVKSGRFRRDLWYRLSIFPLQIPPLRERPDDIPALATYFAGNAGERLLGTRLVPSEQDIALLCSYPWPGNVRELAAVIERAALLGGQRGLCIAEALEVSAREHETSRAEAPAPVSSGSGSVRTLEVVMIEHIQRALEATGGRIEGTRGAAALLGINPHTLRAKMRKLGIDWSRFRHRSSLGDKEAAHRLVTLEYTTNSGTVQVY